MSCGLIHEKAYVDHLISKGKTVVEIPKGSTSSEAIDLMTKGVDVIVQAVLCDDVWLGRVDLLFKVNKPSPNLGSRSYEVDDTKVSVDTKAGTILQLSVYCDMLSQIQGITPEWMHVIKPGQPLEEDQFRYDDFKAY